MIREATDEDAPAVLELARHFHHGMGARRFGKGASFENCQRDWEAWILFSIANDNGILLVSAEDGGKLSGFLLGVVFAAPWCNLLLTAHENVLWVEEEHRGHGVASQLLESFETLAVELGACIVASGSSTGVRNAKAAQAAKAVRKILTGRGYTLDEKMYVRQLKEV